MPLFIPTVCCTQRLSVLGLHFLSGRHHYRFKINPTRVRHCRFSGETLAADNPIIYVRQKKGLPLYATILYGSGDVSSGGVFFWMSCKDMCVSCFPLLGGYLSDMHLVLRATCTRFHFETHFLRCHLLMFLAASKPVGEVWRDLWAVVWDVDQDPGQLPFRARLILFPQEYITDKHHFNHMLSTKSRWSQTWLWPVEPL